MTEQEATLESHRAARAAGRNPDDYSDPQVTRDGVSWRFFYQMKPPAPVGGHFSVDVDDQTGESRFIPGR